MMQLMDWSRSPTKCEVLRQLESGPLVLYRWAIRELYFDPDTACVGVDLAESEPVLWVLGNKIADQSDKLSYSMVSNGGCKFKWLSYLVSDPCAVGLALTGRTPATLDLTPCRTSSVSVARSPLERILSPLVRLHRLHLPPLRPPLHLPRRPRYQHPPPPASAAAHAIVAFARLAERLHPRSLRRAIVGSRTHMLL